MTAHRQHEHARRISGLVWQTMNQRGIQCVRTDVNQGLQELSGAQLERIEDATALLAKGGDSRDAFELLAAFRTITRSAARSALREQRVVWRTDVLLQVAIGSAERFNPALTTILGSAASPSEREAAVGTLRDLCGSLADCPDVVPASSGPSSSGVEITTVAPAPPPARPRGDAPEKSLPRKAKVYGKSAALTVEHALLRDGTATTVMVEAAAKLSSSDSYDWRNKIAFQLTVRELPQFLAVLMGWIDGSEFRFHGQDNNKSLLTEHQPHGLYLALSLAGRKLGVPVDDADRYALATLVVSAMALNEPLLTSSTVLEIARATMLPPLSQLEPSREGPTKAP